jgi:Fe-S cluster biosynthesis and repair protein YggX
MELILAVLGGMLVAALSRLVSDEFKAWRPWIVERLILIAERRLPAKHRKRLAEEWRSYIAEIPGDVGKVIAACGFIKASNTIRGRVSFAPLDQLFSLAALAALFPFLIMVFFSLLIEQRRWPLIRVRRRWFGQRVTVWKFRTHEGIARMSTFARICENLGVDDLPLLFDAFFGRVPLPVWPAMKRWFQSPPYFVEVQCAPRRKAGGRALWQPR